MTTLYGGRVLVAPFAHENRAWIRSAVLAGMLN
jgi:hypothetical protein